MDHSGNTETFISDAAIPDKVKNKHYLAISGDGVPQKVLEYDLKKEITVIGRGDGCDLVLKDPKISRKHLKIVLESDTSVRVLDMGSSNGVFIGEKKVENATLKYGDEISLGNTKMKYFYQESGGSGKKIYELE
jgi:pSer/pThr/pTyr-binding forkhead associated (FHA) protein